MIRPKTIFILPADDVHYLGDLVQPPFDGELPPPGHWHWTPIYKRKLEGGASMVFLRKDGSLASCVFSHIDPESPGVAIVSVLFPENKPPEHLRLTKVEAGKLWTVGGFRPLERAPEHCSPAFAASRRAVEAKSGPEASPYAKNLAAGKKRLQKGDVWWRIWFGNSSGLVQVGMAPGDSDLKALFNAQKMFPEFGRQHGKTTPGGSSPQYLIAREVKGAAVWNVKAYKETWQL